MKQKLFMLAFLVLLMVVLVGLNAASYVQREKTPDSEFRPNRSSFNPGTTGTQALYTLLYETGNKVIRWQAPPSGLLTDKNDTTRVFVIVGPVRREFTKAETDDILLWVSRGGRLVVIDRDPPGELVDVTPNWKITFAHPQGLPAIFNMDPADERQMVGDTVAVKPGLPTLYTANVNAIQPSKLVSSINLERVAAPPRPMTGQGSGLGPGTGSGSGSGGGDAPPPPAKATPKPAAPEPEQDDDDVDLYHPPVTADRAGGMVWVAGPEKKLYSIKTDPPPQVPKIDIEGLRAPAQVAPAVHFANKDQNYLVDVAHGQGKITFLSDPYIVSNSGLSLADNAQLAINLVRTSDGVIAFDEYHQGYGANNLRFLQFFEGTPVVAIFFQGVLIVGFLFFSQSRRFARPVPEHEPDRLSKLEYVAAMAELQQRTRAWDLAIENIYTEFRRRSTRILGLDNLTAKTREIADAIAERTGLDRGAVDQVLFKCEEIVRGEPTNKKEVIELSATLRDLEAKLGVRRSAGNKV